MYEKLRTAVVKDDIPFELKVRHRRAYREQFRRFLSATEETGSRFGTWLKWREEKHWWGSFFYLTMPVTPMGVATRAHIRSAVKSPALAGLRIAKFV